jgi:hypothetical protein
MNLDLLNLLKYIGIAGAVVVVGAALEVLLRAIFARFGTPATNDAPHRIGTEQPRVLHHP